MKRNVPEDSDSLVHCAVCGCILFTFIVLVQNLAMSEQNNSDSSTSESEVSACSPNFNPIKALYSKKTIIPVKNAPMFENVSHFETAQNKKNVNVIPALQKELVKKRQEEKEKKKLEEEKQLLEKNKERFAQYKALMPTKQPWKAKNVLTRMEKMEGPLGVLKECVDKRLRVKIITRKDTGVRGVLHATVIAFDKQWNLGLSDVIEVWKKKSVKKRKIPPAMGTPVPKGSAAKICKVPEVLETPIGKGVFECSRHVSQMMVRGEHIVLVNVVER